MDVKIHDLMLFEEPVEPLPKVPAKPKPPQEPKNESVFLILDTESYGLSTELGAKTVLPLQIAWAICKWNEQLQKLETLKRVICYVSEIICTSRLRDAVRAISEGNFLKHEAKLKTTMYPMLNVKQIFQGLKKCLLKYNVNCVAAYNISWDFDALGNLLRLFYPGPNSNCPVLQSFSSACDNPFNLFKIQHVDLMHEVVKKYGDQLVQSGIADGTIHHNGKRIMLRKDSRYSKTVFSAEYVLEDFFNVSQKHLADDDVEHERLLLEKCLCDFGINNLEYGILYPQSSCFQVMIRKAIRAFPEERIMTVSVPERKKSSCWFIDDDNDNK